MPWLTIPYATPLVINLDYVLADGTPPPAPHSLELPLGAFLWAAIGPMVPSNVVSDIQTLLSQGLPQTFQNLWAGQQQNIQNQISNVVSTVAPGASSITSNIPQSGGTLQASVDLLGSEVSGLLPPNTAGQQLSLSYSVSGMQVNFSGLIIPSDLVLTLFPILGFFGGSVATPSWSLSFNGQLNVYMAVPNDTTIPMAYKVEFSASNISQLKRTNAAAVFAYPIVALSNSIPSLITVPVSSPDLTNYFSEMVQGFSVAASFGFKQLSVQINTNNQNAVQFDLTHPFDASPVLSDYYVPWLMKPSIQLSTSTAHPGDQVTVTGMYWFATDPTTISLTWTDTTSGPVTQSEMQYGQVFPPNWVVPPPNPVPSIFINRTSSPPAYQAQGLMPSTTYAFRVRNYDLQNLVATQWSAWQKFTTAPAAGTWALISLSDDPSLTLQTATILPGGSFVTTITIPTTQKPGIYDVLALALPITIAQQPLTVIDSKEPLPAMLELYDPNTGSLYAAPNPLNIMSGNTVYLAGANWQSGEVDLYVNSTGGAPLGTPIADASGQFKRQLVWPNSGLDATQILAQQGSVGVSLPIQVEPIPQ